MKIQHFFLALLLLVTAFPVFANDDPYSTALELIQEAAESRTTVLHLHRLGLTELPPEIGQLTWLRELNLSNNALSDLPAEIANLQELRSLELSNNNFQALPVVVTELENLMWLNLGYNQLLTLPPEISNLSNLTRLYAHNNQLSYLPPEIGDLSRLERLYLSHNNLVELPEEVGNLSYLQMIVIDDNQLVDIPDVLAELPYLRVSVVSLIDAETREANRVQDYEQESQSAGRSNRGSNAVWNNRGSVSAYPINQSPGINIGFFAPVAFVVVFMMAALFGLLLILKAPKRKRKEF